MKNVCKYIAFCLCAVLAVILAVCEPAAAETAPAPKNGDVVVLYTSDIHCGVEKGFGFAGLWQVRETLEAQGYTTLLVDIGVCGGGAIRSDLEKGDITYDMVLTVLPFQSQGVIIRATGQQILDGLEWGTRSVPDEHGGFLQVSGLSYEIDVSVPSGCRNDENGMMTGIEGERRVRSVMVNGQPIDPAKFYTVASTDYYLLDNGDGFTAFSGAEVLQSQFKLDSQMLIDYIVDDLGGVIGEEYADPFGQGRIVITGQ